MAKLTGRKVKIVSHNGCKECLCVGLGTIVNESFTGKTVVVDPCHPDMSAVPYKPVDLRYLNNKEVKL